MGNSQPKPIVSAEPEYALGVLGKPTVAVTVPPVDVAHVNELIARADFIRDIRTSMSQPFNEREELARAAAFSDATIIDKISLMIDKYASMITFPAATYCPAEVIDPATHKPRPATPYDHLFPTQESACVRDQLRSQLAKYARWINTRKWTGDTAKSGPETVPVDRDALLQMLVRLPQSILFNIEAATTATRTGAGVSAQIFDQIYNFRAYVLVLVIVVILLLWWFQGPVYVKKKITDSTLASSKSIEMDI